MTKNGLVVALVVVAAGCGSTSDYAGVYTANFDGTYSNTSPNTASGTYQDTATITVTDVGTNRIELRWQDGSNPPSEAIVFTLTKSRGTAVPGTDGGGNCYTNRLDNGNVQTNCCTQCSITFSGTSLTQSQSGTYTGTTQLNDTYAGNYNGAWTGNRTN